MVFVKTTKRMESDTELFANYGTNFRCAGGCVCHLCRQLALLVSFIVNSHPGLELFNLGMNKSVPGVKRTTVGMKLQFLWYEKNHQEV